jgi:murein L,D-transpeptidase YcbB/YkuD
MTFFPVRTSRFAVMSTQLRVRGGGIRKVTRSGRNLRPGVLSRGIGLAAFVFSITLAAAEDPAVAESASSLRLPPGPEAVFDTGGFAAIPLLAAFHAPHESPVETLDSASLAGVWPPATRHGPILAETGASEGPPQPSAPTLAEPTVEIPPSTADEPPARPIIPGRAESAPPEPVPTAIEAALVRLIVHDGAVNPLGVGDWRGARAAIGAFYADRRFAPVWVEETGLTEAGRAALAQLERARQDGLNLSAITLPRHLEARLAPNDLAEAETTISEAVVIYAEQASGSRVMPWRVSPIVSDAPSVVGPGVALAETAAAPDPAERLADFNPPQKGYRLLRDELNRLVEAGGRGSQREGGGAPDLVAGPLVSPPLLEADAEPTPKIRTVRDRLSALSRNAAAAASSDRGLARRRTAILANMEMWRWEPRDMGERRIEVNVPDFTVTMMEGDAVVHSARVVVGKPATPTPIFSNVMRYVLINPAWQVPDSIIRKEMLPKLASDPNYLSRRGYEVKTVGGRVTVTQRPGEDNALGRIAFMFPNDHSIYLHDTPSQSLFDADMRAFSHGCVRVEDPLRLAELVLGWSEERISAAIGGPERTVFLPRPVPIHIEYFTEFVDESGELQERPDVYGLTQKVAGILSGSRQD